MVERTENSEKIWALYQRLTTAIEQDQTGELKNALEDGANPNLVQNKHSPLYNVLTDGNRVAIVDLLYAAGARLNDMDRAALQEMRQDIFAAACFSGRETAKRYYSLVKSDGSEDRKRQLKNKTTDPTAPVVTLQTLWQDYGLDFDLTRHKNNLEYLQPGFVIQFERDYNGKIEQFPKPQKDDGFFL